MQRLGGMRQSPASLGNGMLSGTAGISACLAGLSPHFGDRTGPSLSLRDTGELALPSQLQVRARDPGLARYQSLPSSRH